MYRYCQKERLKISKLSEFESDVTETSEDMYLREVTKFHRRLYGGAQTCPPPHKRLQNFAT